MKRRLVLLTTGLALGGLALMFYARAAGPAPAPGPKAHAKEAPPRGAVSRITHVTVYPANALVTREVEVPAGAGIVELVVSPLPERTMNSSLYSEGSDGIRVLATRFRTRPVPEDTREEVRKLEEEMKRLQQTAKKLQADLAACKQNMALMDKLEAFTAASTVHATEKGKMDSEATIALAKYLIEGRTERTKEKVTLEQQLETNSEQLTFLQRKFASLTGRSDRTERDAVIVVEKTDAAPGKVRLNYLVEAASWRPQYKFRAGKSNKDKVGVEYLAAVSQQTGEDWSRVNLVLSTAEPMLNAAPPELKTLAVAVVPRGVPMPGVAAPIPSMPAGGKPGQFGAFANPMGRNTVKELSLAAQSLRRQAQMAYNDNKEKKAAEIANYAAALDQACELVVQGEGRGGAVRSGKNEGPSVTYHLSARLTVPSRQDEQVIEVTRLDLEPDYYYRAVPVLTPHVYRQATLINKSKYVLLPGEATMYNGADFVGRMNLPLVAIGEQFTIGFGVEPQLQVARQMMDKSRAMQGGNQVLKYEYCIRVSSFKSERVKVQVWDRLPHAENETLGVSLVKTSPEVSKDATYLREERPNNLLRWDLELESEMNGEKARTIRYEFKLELEKQSTIGSFQSK